MKNRLSLAAVAGLALAILAALPPARGEQPGAKGGAVPPPPPAGEERTAPRPPPPPRLTGVLQMADGTKNAAMIEDPSIRGTGIFRVGDSVGGAKVASISAGEAVLEGPEGRQVLRLAAAPPAVSPAGDTIVFNVENVDLRTVIRLVSDLSGTNLIFDERVRGIVTVMTPRPIPASEAMAMLAAILELRGYALVPAGSFFKVTTKEEAVRANVPVAGEGREQGGGAKK